MCDVLVPEPSLFYVFFDRYLLPEQFAEKDLPVASLADRLDYLNLLFADEEGELDSFLLKVF